MQALAVTKEARPRLNLPSPTPEKGGFNTGRKKKSLTVEWKRGGEQIRNFVYFRLRKETDGSIRPFGSDRLRPRCTGREKRKTGGGWGEEGSEKAKRGE